MTVRSAKASGLPQGTLTPMGALLFSASEQGAWYDPSDLSTLFQDSAGTVPVTAVEQPVGRILDKARPIVTNGDVRMNVLPSEAADWAGGNNTVVGNKIIPNTTNGVHGPYIGIPGTGLDYIIKVKVKAAGYSKFYISDGSYGRVSAAYDLANGTIISAASNIPHDAAIVYFGDGVYELSVKVNAVTVLAVVITPYPDTGATLSAYGASFAGDGVSGVEVYAVDARLVTQADTLPRYQYTPDNTWSRFIGSTHATQATTTKRPILSRRVNLLTKTEQFDDAAWVKSGVGGGLPPTVIENDASGPASDGFADKVTFSSAGAGAQSLLFTLAAFSPAVYRGVLCLKAASPGDVGKIIALRHAASAAYLLITLTADYQVISRNETAPAAVGGSLDIVLRPDVGTSSGEVSIHLAYASLTLATDAHLPYQWVNTASDYDADPAKFPAYLRFDGVDDALQTGNIDFTSTDKMTVWAGVTKLSDAANGMVYEFGSPESANSGTFSMWAPINVASAPLGVTAKGISRSVAATTTFSGASSGVVAQDINLSAPRNALRLNGATLNTLTTALGGAFGNFPFDIGARAGTPPHFNGRIYSLIVRGAQSSLSQIEATELYIKQKMRMP